MEYQHNQVTEASLDDSVSKLLVELNDGFTAYYDHNLQLKGATENVSNFAYSSLIPRSLVNYDVPDYGEGPRVLVVEELIGYNCIIAETKNPQTPWALSVFSDNKSITKIAHDLPLGIINVDANWDAVFVNARCADMFKTSMDELYGRGWTDYVPTMVIREFQSHMTNPELRRSLFKTRMEFTSPLGKVYVFSVQLAAHFDYRDKFISATITVNDITNEFKAESKLQYMADHDPLTELLNRSAFIRNVEALEEARFNNSLFVFVDLDKFKEVNDSLGHKFGDRVLEIVARRIKAIIRENDLSARFGGDEFVICMPGISTQEIVEAIARKISGALNRKAMVDGREVMIQCSLGIAWTPTIQFEEGVSRSVNVQAVVDAADQGMYEVKKGSVTAVEHFKIYDVNLREQQRRIKNQRAELNTIIENDEIITHFQPIYDLSGAIASVEVLARFSRPLEYFNGIEEIIGFAKRAGVDQQILNTALFKALAGFAELRHFDISLALNLNVDISQLEEEDFAYNMAQMCVEKQIPFKSVCVEMTEVMLERNSQRVEKHIEELAKQGFKISMDDFGTGYSSFKRLMNYNFNELKIDRYFIANMLDTDKFRKTLRAMIAIGKSLNLQILAEGIENKAQYEMCKEMGVHLFQGFYFSEPVDSDTLKKMLEKQNVNS